MLYFHYLTIWEVFHLLTWMSFVLAASPGSPLCFVNQFFPHHRLFPSLHLCSQTSSLGTEQAWPVRAPPPSASEMDLNVGMLPKLHSCELS